jgi:LysR family transcriptional regulator, glycine cleavage system transcriptional activator
VLTEGATAALPEFKEGLDRLDAGLRRLRQRGARALVTVSASQAFVARWLLPRLEQFSALHPEVDVRLDVSDRLVDIEHGEADLGIRCGPGRWGRLLTTKLMDEEVLPVCSPALFKGKPPPTAAALARHTLIHDMTLSRTGVFPSWAQWFAARGVPLHAARQGLQINASSAVIQAALNGQGVALARRVLVADELHDGRLVRLLPAVAWPIAWGYYVVNTAEAAQRAPVQAFVAWLRAATQAASARPAAAAAINPR